MRKRKHYALELKSGIELAPFVDVLFLLVTYFLMNSTLAKNPSIKIELPKSDTAQVSSAKQFVVFIDKENRIFLNEKPVALQNLSEEINRQSKDKDKDQIIIRGDKKADYQSIISVIDHLNKSGITRFNLATEK
jgi:biopolymer transport protein ExbD